MASSTVPTHTSITPTGVVELFLILGASQEEAGAGLPDMDEKSKKNPSAGSGRCESREEEDDNMVSGGAANSKEDNEFVFAGQDDF